MIHLRDGRRDIASKEHLLLPLEGFRRLAILSPAPKNVYGSCSFRHRKAVARSASETLHSAVDIWQPVGEVGVEESEGIAHVLQESKALIPHKIKKLLGGVAALVPRR